MRAVWLLSVLSLYACVASVNAESVIVSFKVSGNYLKANVEYFAAMAASFYRQPDITVTSAVTSGEQFMAEFTITHANLRKDLLKEVLLLTDAGAQKSAIEKIVSAGIPYVDGTFTVDGTPTTVTGYGLYEVKLQILAVDLNAATTVAGKVQTELRKYFEYGGVSVVAQEITARRSLLSNKFQLVIMVAGTTDVIATAKKNAENPVFQKGLYAQLAIAGIQVAQDTLTVGGKAATYKPSANSAVFGMVSTGVFFLCLTM